MVFNAILNSSQFSQIPYFSLMTRMIFFILLFAGVGLWFYGKQKVNKGLIFVVAVIIGVFLIVMKESESQIAIMMLLYMMIINKDIEPRQFCKKYVVATVFAMLLVFALCCIGVFPNEYRYRLTSDGMTKYRYYLGFNTATVAANFAFHISLAYLFYKQEKFKFKDALLVIIPNTLLYILTDTRAAYFETLLAVTIFCFLKSIRTGWFKKMIGFLSIWSMPIFAGAELYIANNYTTSNPIYVAIDAAFSYRLSWAVKALKSYPIGLFGNNVTWAANGYTETAQLVDMFYLRCAIQYGVIFLCIIIIGFMGMSAYFKSKENYFGCTIIIILALHSITDPQLLEYSCVPLLILFLNGYRYIHDTFSLKKRRRRKLSREKQRYLIR